jgi:hypothetical protein
VKTKKSLASVPLRFSKITKNFAEFSKLITCNLILVVHLHTWKSVPHEALSAGVGVGVVVGTQREREESLHTTIHGSLAFRQQLKVAAINPTHPVVGGYHEPYSPCD